MPIALWAYLSTLMLSIVAASSSTLTFHLEPFYGVFYLVLLAGLLKGSRVCRLLLTLLTALSAYGLFVIQTGAFDLAGLLLVALCFAQVAFLCAPQARAFASRH